MKSTPENKVKKKLIEYLKGRDLKERSFSFSISDRYHAGMPDIFSIYSGFLEAFECKASDKNPTKIQLNILKRIDRAGGDAFIVRLDKDGELTFEKITA